MFGSNPQTPTAGPSSSGNGNGTHQPKFNSVSNRLSSDVRIKGDVTFSSELVIDGQVEGNIISDGVLMIGANGKVIGDIQVGAVTVQGLVEGDILASERCALHAGASLAGNVESPRLAVDESASFVGSATVTAKRS